MAHVTLTISGRPYTVGCADGEEDRLRDLGHELDRRARTMAEATGAVGEGLLLVLAGLMLADEVADAKATAEPLRADMAAQEEELTGLRSRVAELERQMDESRAALQEAHQRLEQRREENAGRAQQDEEIARAIETLASRIETVAERLSAS